MTRKGFGAAVSVLCLLAVVFIGIVLLGDLRGSADEITISHDSGIYEESLELNLRLWAPGTIYYTTDGTTPGPSNENASIYEEPLYLEAGEETSVYGFQFCCLFDDGKVSDVYRRDYILDGSGKDRFTTTYIVSISGKEEDLFGYEEGILVRGRLFDEYMAANPDVNVLNTIIPANYWAEKEVPVHMSVFDGNGQELLEQNCGMKIYGNVTRAKNQKSFRLISRYEYDGVNEFAYGFLPKLLSEEGNTTVDAFQRLSFHNAGNDNGYAFLRTELIGELARQSGFEDVMVAESAVVYVNGRYQGFYWLENAFDDRYFSEKYGNYGGEMVLCEGGLSEMDIQQAETDLEKAYTESYNEFCRWALDADMNDEQDWERVCRTIDVENFARYMAIEYYVGNHDWPHNNVKVYRYHCAEGENYRENSVFDGRYRYLLYDTDYGLGLKFLGWFGVDEYNRRLEELSGNLESAALFQKLLQREEFKNQFVNSVLHLINGSFASENVVNTLLEYREKMYCEVYHMMEETDLLKNSIWETDDNGIGNVDTEINEIIQFARNRTNVVVDEIRGKWDCGDIMTLKVTQQEQNLLINGEEITGEFTGCVLGNIPVTITGKETPGIHVTGYYLNDTFVEGKEITFLPGEWNNGEMLVTVRAQYDIEKVESLEIAAYHIRGQEDYVCVRNNGQLPVLLSDYSITDSKADASKGRFPDVQLLPGEEYYVYGKEYTGAVMQNSTRITFGWATDEPVLLYHKFKGLADAKNVNSMSIELEN